MSERPFVFLSYAREDIELVRKIYQELDAAGFRPWMDVEDLLPGELWESMIQQAIRDADFFLACISTRSVTKRGVIQKEIRKALDVWEEKLEHDIYLIPARLEACQVPESLARFQWVDLFREDGIARLTKAIKRGLERRTRPPEQVVQEPMFTRDSVEDDSNPVYQESVNSSRCRYCGALLPMGAISCPTCNASSSPTGEDTPESGTSSKPRSDTPDVQVPLSTGIVEPIRAIRRGMKCQYCGATLRDGAKFCKSCGNLVGESPAVANQINPAKPAQLPLRGARIGNYHAVGLWREHSHIFWVEPLKPNASAERYLAIPETQMLNSVLLMKLCALSQPQLARVLDQARGENRRWYLIVNRVEGLPLDAVQANLGAMRATKMFEKILHAMKYMHDQGWVIMHGFEPINLEKRVQQFLRIRHDGATALAEHDPLHLLQQAIAVDAKDNPVLFDFTLWEPAPVLQSEREERVKEDMQLTVKMLYWLRTSGRLTHELEKLRQTGGQIEQFIINVLQQAYPSFREMDEIFSQIVKRDIT